MYLKSINIKNFRKIQEAKCLFNPGLNLIVGPNDSGKTAIIDAIRFTLRQVVDDYTRISPYDFKEQRLEINIDLVFSFEDCEERQLVIDSALFAEYLAFTTDNKPELRIWYTIKSNEKDIKFPEFKVGPTKNAAVDMDARCKENLQVVYLRPLRDAESELKARQSSRISKILNKHEDIKNSEAELVELLKNFKKDSEVFFDDGKGKPIADEIRRLLKLFDEQAVGQKKEIKFGPTEKLDCLKTLEKIALYYTDLPYPGLGTLNMIFIAAELLHINTQKTPKLILIEEIEAHLHPQRQLKIIKALQEESKKGIQMILTTHSPNLASVVEIDRLNICCEGNLHSLAKGETELAPENYAYLERFLDVTKSNLFFTQGILFVEGPTEQILLPEFAKILGYNLTDYGVSIISTNGLAFKHFVNIFKRKKEPYNKIPIAVITDADKKSLDKINTYISKISNENNNIGCFVGDQLYMVDEQELTNKTTFEKIVIKKTEKLKEIFIKSLGAKVKSPEEASDVEKIYKMIKPKKHQLLKELLNCSQI